MQIDIDPMDFLQDLEVETIVETRYTNDPGSDTQYICVRTKLYWKGQLISESEGEDFVH